MKVLILPHLSIFYHLPFSIFLLVAFELSEIYIGKEWNKKNNVNMGFKTKTEIFIYDS